MSGQDLLVWLFIAFNKLTSRHNLNYISFLEIQHLQKIHQGSIQMWYYQVIVARTQTVFFFFFYKIIDPRLG